MLCHSRSKDPVGYLDVDNSFSYVRATPVTSVDPSGLQSGIPPIMQQEIENLINQITGGTHKVTCDALEDIVEWFLDTEKVKELWRNYTDNPVRNEDIKLSSAETCKMMGSALDASRPGLVADCKSGGSGGPLTGSGQADPPYAGAVGRFEFSGGSYYTCYSCSLQVHACFSEPYDFDVKSFLRLNGRSLSNHVKTALVNIADGQLDCGWRPFTVSGCCTQSISTKVVPLIGAPSNAD